MLDMRQQPEGGDVRRPCGVVWSNGIGQTQRDLLVLVHGFNNNRFEAQQAYAGFRSRQKGLLDPGAGERLESVLGDAFWPGDASFAGPLDIVDFLIYPATIETAQQAAAVLSAYILGLRDVLNLSFIGHSMGCRVILETIRLLVDTADFKTPIRKVSLLAAAVPTFAVLPGGRLAAAFQAPAQVQVLHSKADLVLAGAFPIGQTVAGDGFLPSAIGRHGDVPASPGRVEVRPVDGAGHSDYWGWRDNRPSAAAAGLIHDFMSFGEYKRTVAPGRMMERVVQEERAEIGGRRIGD
ncbi:alpha/beta hydrolase [Pelomonas sp. Root1444]|uniref:alpha/beta hydrolase n=1 Tax=Pelomonas sp. Root1444 TaxID=1736464 RepID=UPI0012F888F1|nr:alpha/beta hydrolase [Pelomonas sp. Root1444]